MMKPTIRNWALACVTLLASTGNALAAERATVNRRTGLYELPLTDLRKAAERGDRAELARLAARLGPGRLAKALQDPDRRNVLAALDGIRLLDSGILLLEGVLPLLGSTDEGIRAHAVAASAALFAASDTARLADFEVAEETTQATCRVLAKVAANEAESLSTRLLAIQGLADAPPACAASRKPAELLASREPEIRRAAVLGLLPSSSPALVAAAQDRHGGVAAAAGARLCERRTSKQPLPAEPPLRKLALAEGAQPEDVIAMLPCLAASTDPADRAAIEELRTAGAMAVRDAIKRLQYKPEEKPGPPGAPAISNP
jgi:hypothetical protein